MMEKNHFERRATPDATPLSKDEILKRMRSSEDTDSVRIPRRQFETVREIFPAFVWRQVEEDIALIEDAAPGEMNQSKLQLIAEALAAERHHTESLDHLTGLYSQKYVREELAEYLQAELSDKSAESFDHIARISVDLNGLKAVNDLHDGQHVFGDRYIQAIGASLKESKTIEALRLTGARVIIAREHGDDFSLTIMGARGTKFDASELERITQNIQSEIEATQLPNDLMPQTLIEEKIGAAPTDFHFFPSAAVGAFTAEKILKAGISGRNAVSEEDSHKRIAQKIMGAFIDASEIAMKNDKARQKEALAQGSDADRYYMKAISPRDETLVRAVEEKNALIASQQKIIEQLLEKIARLEALDKQQD